MFKAVREYLGNYRAYRREAKRINEELDRDGVYKYIERHYGFDTPSAPVLRQKHG